MVIRNPSTAMQAHVQISCLMKFPDTTKSLLFAINNKYERILEKGDIVVMPKSK